MSKNRDKSEIYKMLFLNLVYSMQTAALQNLGQQENPMTDEMTVDLEQAENYIDLLEMLKMKTENNLEKEEKQFLTNALTELQTIYVSEKNKK